MRETDGLSYGENQRYRKLDNFITKYFPLVVLLCIFLSALYIYKESASVIHEYIYNICLGFASGFVLLGLVCLFYVDKPVIEYRYFLPIMIVTPMVLSVFLFELHGPEFTPNIFISQFYLFLSPGEVTLLSVILGCYIIELTIVSVAAAVFSVISAYFRKYFSKILIGPTENNPNKIVKKASFWLFDIPDVLDIHDVVLDPESDEGKFNKRVFWEIMTGIIISGTAICSFIFLSPYFVNEMTIEIMLMTSVLLSLFISALIVPWHIVRNIGVKAKSDAPRDVYLWKGMRKRLNASAAVILFFLLLFTMLAYLKMDLTKVLIIYASYGIFILVISALYAFLYTNNFYHRFKEGMIENFRFEKQIMLDKIEKESQGNSK